MRILAQMVMKNESDKWLDSVLSWNRQWWDDIHIFDDLSDDNSVQVAQKYTHNVVRRGDDIPSFIEHEGRFRQAAWDSMEDALEPEEGDWIFAIDADEFFVGNHKQLNPRDALEDYIEFAENTGKSSVSFVVPEVWDVTQIEPLIRVDGFWAKNKNIRFAKWQPNGKFRDTPMGCGSVPLYGEKNVVNTITLAWLLHFGYAIPEQVNERYKRYTSLSNHGHNNKHIESIVGTPELRPWDGEVPFFWRGVK